MSGRELVARTATSELAFNPDYADFHEGPAARWTLRVLFATVVVAVLLTSILRLDRVVTSRSGAVTSVEPNVTVQVLEDSIIRALKVKEGDRVKAGQLLARLDPTFTTADVNQLIVQVASAEAQIARLVAERDGKIFTGAGLPSNEIYDEYARLQVALFTQRRAQYIAQVESFDAKIAANRASVEKLKEEEKQLTERLSIFKEIEAMRVTLEASKISSRLQLLQSMDQRIEIARNLELARNSMRETEHQYHALVSDKEAQAKLWSAQVGQDLVTANQTRDAAREQLAKAKKRQDLVSVYAPEDGVVFKLARLSEGSILKSGEQFLQIVPTRSPLEAEVQVAAEDIGFIRPDDPCTIKLEPFNFVEHGWATGSVRWISEGIFTLDDDGKPVPAYYKARISISEMQLRNVPESARLVPGMQVTTDIHVGSRTVLAYLFHGLVQQFGEAMRER